MPPATQTQPQGRAREPQGRETQSREVPRYKLTEAAYLKSEEDRFERMYEPGEEIEFVGVPGYHMEPLNEAAEAMVEKHKPQQFDFNSMVPLKS